MLTFILLFFFRPGFVQKASVDTSKQPSIDYVTTMLVSLATGLVVFIATLFVLGYKRKLPKTEIEYASSSETS